MDDYETRAQATAAARLARILHDAGILSESRLIDFLYPNLDAIETAEEGKVP